MNTFLTGRLVNNFSFAEMTNKDNPSGPALRIDTPEAIDHLIMMQELREWAFKYYPTVFRNGLRVSSWYRTPEYNALPWVKGAVNSAHLDCRATDIDNIPQAYYGVFVDAWKVICSIHGRVGGCELYSWGMHFDSYSDKFGVTTFRLKDNR